MDARNILETPLAAPIMRAFSGIASARVCAFGNDIPGAAPAGWDPSVTGRANVTWIADGPVQALGK